MRPSANKVHNIKKLLQIRGLSTSYLVHFASTSEGWRKWLWPKRLLFATLRDKFWRVTPPPPLATCLAMLWKRTNHSSHNLITIVTIAGRGNCRLALFKMPDLSTEEETENTTCTSTVNQIKVTDTKLMEGRIGRQFCFFALAGDR